MIDYKKEFEIEKLSISEPIKKDSTWVLDVKYDGIALCFQTPSLGLEKSKKELRFDSSKKYSFFKFINNIEDVIIDYIYLNSEKIFKGKKFTKERLRDSLISSWDVCDNGIVTFPFDNFMSKSICILSPIDEKISYDDLYRSVSCIIFLDSIVFTKDKFDIKYNISHIKSKKFTTEPNYFYEPTSIVETSTEAVVELVEDTGDFF
jgi:hypothetical protein